MISEATEAHKTNSSIFILTPSMPTNHFKKRKNINTRKLKSPNIERLKAIRIQSTFSWILRRYSTEISFNIPRRPRTRPRHHSTRKELGRRPGTTLHQHAQVLHCQLGPDFATCTGASCIWQPSLPWTLGRFVKLFYSLFNTPGWQLRRVIRTRRARSCPVFLERLGT